LIFRSEVEKGLNSLNIRFLLVGGNETPFSSDFSDEDQTVPS